MRDSRLVGVVLSCQIIDFLDFCLTSSDSKRNSSLNSLNDFWTVILKLIFETSDHNRNMVAGHSEYDLMAPRVGSWSRGCCCCWRSFLLFRESDSPTFPLGYASFTLLCVSSHAEQQTHRCWELATPSTDWRIVGLGLEAWSLFRFHEELGSPGHRPCQVEMIEPWLQWLTKRSWLWNFSSHLFVK